MGRTTERCPDTLPHQVKRAERAKLAQYESYSQALARDRKQEQMNEKDERYSALMEEMYTLEVMTARETEKFAQAKEAEVSSQKRGSCLQRNMA